MMTFFQIFLAILVLWLFLECASSIKNKQKDNTPTSKIEAVICPDCASTLSNDMDEYCKPNEAVEDILTENIEIQHQENCYEENNILSSSKVLKLLLLFAISILGIVVCFLLVIFAIILLYSL